MPLFVTGGGIVGRAGGLQANMLPMETGGVSTYFVAISDDA